MTKLKGYRKKDLDILKLLAKLAVTNAKNADAVLEKRMRMFGYSDKETAFLNFVLMYFVERPDRISLSGLTAEKWAECIRGIFARKRDISRRSLCTLFTDFKNIWETFCPYRR
mgnify:FL=1